MPETAESTKKIVPSQKSVVQKLGKRNNNGLQTSANVFVDKSVDLEESVDQKNAKKKRGIKETSIIFESTASAQEKRVRTVDVQPKIAPQTTPKQAPLVVAQQS